MSGLHRCARARSREPRAARRCRACGGAPTTPDRNASCSAAPAEETSTPTNSSCASISRLAFRTALVLTRNAADAEEAAQDGFVKAWRALRRFDAARPFRPWLLAIVANEARNRRRAAGAGASCARAARRAASAAAAPSPEARAARRRARHGARRRAGAPRRARPQVIACRYLLELSEAETAAALGCRAGTVKSRLSRALARLRAQAARSGALDG